MGEMFDLISMKHWIVLMTVIIVDTYPFLVFSDLTCPLEDTRECVFSCYTVPHDAKQTEIGSSDWEAFPPTGKNTETVLAQCCACVPGAIFGGADIPEVPGCHFVTTTEPSVRVTKLCQLYVGQSWVTQLILVISLYGVIFF